MAAVKRCDACKHANRTGDALFCRRFPPQVVALPVSNSLRQTSLMPAATFPAMSPDAWCGEWAEGTPGESQPPQKSMLAN